MKFKFIDFDIDEGLLKGAKATPRTDLNKKVIDKFYKYTGITPGTKITEKDIDDHWLDAFGRIGLEEGLSNESLQKILLQK